MLKVCVRLFGSLKIPAATGLAVLQPALARTAGSNASSGGKLDRGLWFAAKSGFGGGSF